MSRKEFCERVQELLNEMVLNVSERESIMLGDALWRGWSGVRRDVEGLHSEDVDSCRRTP